MKKAIFLLILFVTFTSFSAGKSGTGFKLVQPNIYKLQDACNVYLLKSGHSGILIDAGSERLDEALAEIGVDQIDWVLHTHFHRDQSSGSAALRNKGAKIAIGELEKDYLHPAVKQGTVDPADRYLLREEVANYGSRMEPFQKMGVDLGLSEGDSLTWNQFQIRTLDTPGHTKGSVSYVIETAGRTLVFSGDLIMEGGYVRNLYSMQWIYLQNPGIDSSLVSIDKISSLDPDLLLPSHGSIIETPQLDLRLLKSRLEGVQETLYSQRAARWNWSNFIQVSDHVIQDCGSTSQLVISESGEALLFDCGKEFTPERLAEAKQKFGIKRIAVIIPSHWHYDHIDGIPAIAKAEGAEIWVWNKLQEHVESPEHFVTTCWTETRFKADRVLSEGERFEWGGYSFAVFHNPVHMEEQMGMSALVDGIRFYFIADGSSINRNGLMRSSIHCYNGISTYTGLIKTAQSFYDADPYICLGAHSNAFALHTDARHEFREWAVNTTDALRNILPPGRSEVAFNPYWASFYPAKQGVKPGEKGEVVLRIKNRESRPVAGTVCLKSSEDLVFGERELAFSLGPGEDGSLTVSVSVKKTVRPGTHIITADVEFDHELFGEFPHAYIQVDE